MKVTEGNLIDLAENGEYDIIVQGCNCFNRMNSGIAKEIRTRYPQVYEADTKFIPKDPAGRLGKFSIAPCRYKKNNPELDQNIFEFKVVNAYTQFRYASYSGEVVVNYEALATCFSGIAHQFGNLRIAYPKIGAGLGGGDWNIIADIIDKELAGCDHTLVLLPK